MYGDLIFHSLAWSGDEQGYIAKSRCLEIYQTFEEKWKIAEVCESKFRLQEVEVARWSRWSGGR